MAFPSSVAGSSDSVLDQKLVTIQYFQPFQCFLILHLHLAPENLSSCQYPHSFVTCDCKIVIILQLNQKDPCISDDHTIYQLLKSKWVITFWLKRFHK
ncbi:unnamed protein product [Rhizophagus irregularis]|nr:unnamed protein product [Rhizophagus irregularis]